MLHALRKFILFLIAKHHEVLLMWDANSLSSDLDDFHFLRSCTLLDLFSTQGIPSTASNSSRGRLIDLMHGTPLIHTAVRRGGISSFHLSPLSDHWALYIDLDEHSLFKESSTNPTAPSHRLPLRLRKPEQCARYLALVNQYLRLQIKSIMHIGSRVLYAKWHRIFVYMIIFGSKI